MFEIFVGMEVEVTVKDAIVDAPASYTGTLLESDDNRIVMDVTSYRSSVYNKFKKMGGKIIINNRYIISMFVATN